MTEEDLVSLADSSLQPPQFPERVLKIIMDFRKNQLAKGLKKPNQPKKPLTLESTQLP